jgi:hypothetical protein
MPGKALHWRHHQNWVSAQLLPLTSPYFKNSRDRGLTTSHKPLFWYPGRQALPYTSWVKIRGRSLCFQQREKIKGERKDPGKQLSLYFWGRNEVTNEGGEVSYRLHILLIFWMKQSQQWWPKGPYKHSKTIYVFTSGRVIITVQIHRQNNF